MIDQELISSSPLFRGIGSEKLAVICRFFTEKEISEGTAIFVENMSGESLYFIVSGTVRISKMISEGEEKTLVVLGPDDFFGEMAIIDGEPRSATARVIENARLLALKKNDFEILCKENPELALLLVLNIMSVFTSRVRESNQEIKDIILWQHKRN